MLTERWTGTLLVQSHFRIRSNLTSSSGMLYYQKILMPIIFFSLYLSSLYFCAVQLFIPNFSLAHIGCSCHQLLLLPYAILQTFPTYSQPDQHHSPHVMHDQKLSDHWVWKPSTYSVIECSITWWNAFRPKIGRMGRKYKFSCRIATVVTYFTNSCKFISIFLPVVQDCNVGLTIVNINWYLEASDIRDKL